MEDGGGQFVDASRAELRGADHLVGIEEGLACGGAGDESRHRRRIAADIEDAAAGELVGEEDGGRLEGAAQKPKLALISRISPTAPSSTSSMSFLVRGWKRYMKASARKTLAFFAAAIMAIASAQSTPSGFSQRTCLPASAALIPQWTWSGCGVAT